MKKVLVLSLLMLFSAVAFATPTLNPWFEVNVPAIVNGVMPEPTFDAGAILSGWVSQTWFMDVGFSYVDDNLLDTANKVTWGFETNIGFDELASVNQTGSLLYGCELTAWCDITYVSNYPAQLNIDTLIPGFEAMGYVGPLEVWGGVSLPYDSYGAGNFGLEPFFGMRVDFDISL